MSDFKRFMPSVISLDKRDALFLMFLPAGLEQLHAALVSGRGHLGGPMGRQLSAATQWM